MFGTNHTLLRLIQQYLKFGIVGVLATAVHIGTLVCLVESLSADPVLMNVVAFGIALTVSYLGNSFWTFGYRENGQVTGSVDVQSFAKYGVTAIIGLAFNTAVVFAVVRIVGASYLYALPGVAIATPVFVFCISKYWVFARHA